MNIYEQLNKIDDQESLSEKYNVKNAKELQKLKESSVSYKYTDQVWSVVSKDDPENAVFTGDKEECERFAKQQNLTPAARARDPRGGYYIVKQGADVPVITESSVSSRYTDDVWTVSFKNDPEYPIFKGDKDECDRFIKNNSLNAATKARGGLVVKRGDSVPVITESSEKYGESLKEDTHNSSKSTKDLEEAVEQIIADLQSKGFDDDDIAQIGPMIRNTINSRVVAQVAHNKKYASVGDANKYPAHTSSQVSVRDKLKKTFPELDI